MCQIEETRRQVRRSMIMESSRRTSGQTMTAMKHTDNVVQHVEINWTYRCLMGRDFLREDTYIVRIIARSLTMDHLFYKLYGNYTIVLLIVSFIVTELWIYVVDILLLISMEIT